MLYTSFSTAQRRTQSQSPTRRKLEEQRGRKQEKEVEEVEVEDRELLSPWETPLEIRRILGMDVQDQEQV